MGVESFELTDPHTHMRMPVSPQLQQKILSNFWIFASVIVQIVYVSRVLIRIFLTMSEVKHVFIDLKVI